MTRSGNDLFGRVALHQKLITQEQLNRAIGESAANPGLPLGRAMVHLGFLSDSQVDQILDMQKRILRKAEAAHAEARPQDDGRKQTDRPAMPSAVDYTRIEQYLELARMTGASDLHIAVGSPPTIRLHGELEYLNRESFTAQDTEALFQNLLTQKQMTDLRAHKSVEFSLCLNESRYRGCVFKQRNGYDGAFRVIRDQIPSFSDLGLPAAASRLTGFHQGLILVTGPAGHGKSTTLATLIEHINRSRAEHIITIEDPVEYVFQSKSCIISQREVNTHTESFAMALRAALREDPDIIMVGELRDLESISLAITAAETGHLVFGTLHTTSAARTINRILDVYPPDQQAQIRTMLSETLMGTITQYLVPRADGNGRVLACEVLIMNSAASNLIREEKVFQIRSFIQTGGKRGMVLMDNSLLDLVRRRTVKHAVALRYAEDQKAFKGRLVTT